MFSNTLTHLHKVAHTHSSTIPHRQIQKLLDTKITLTLHLMCYRGTSTQPYTLTHTITLIPTRNNPTQRRTHSDRHTPKYTVTHKVTHTCTHTEALADREALTHTNTCTYTHLHTCVRTHTLTPSHTPALSHTHSYSHAL